MTILLNVICKDIRVFFKDKKVALLLVMLPFFFILLFVNIFSSKMDENVFLEPFNIALVDNEKSSNTRLIKGQIENMQSIKKVIETDENKANILLEENKIAAIIVVPSNFTECLLYGKECSVKVIGNKNKAIESFVVKTLTKSATDLFLAVQSAIDASHHFSNKYNLVSQDENHFRKNIIVKALDRNSIYKESNNEVFVDYKLSSGEYFTAALIVIFMMFSGIPSMKMLIQEKNSGLLKRFLTTPIKFWHIVSSKCILTLVISSLQFVMLVFLTWIFLENYWGYSMWSIILLFISINFAISTWMFLIGTLVNTLSAADVIANLSILILAILGGSIYPLTSMPEITRTLSEFTINRWAIEGFMIVFSGNTSLSLNNVLIPLVSIGFFHIILIFGIYKFKESSIFSRTKSLVWG